MFYTQSKSETTLLCESVFLRTLSALQKCHQKFAYCKEASSGSLDQYLRAGTYYVLIETDSVGIPVTMTLAFAHADASTNLVVGDTDGITERYTNSGATQYFSFNLDSPELLGIALAKYDNSSGYYFSICDEHKKVISVISIVITRTKFILLYRKVLTI